MTDIVCPHCRTAFKMDGMGYTEKFKKITIQNQTIIEPSPVNTPSFDIDSLENELNEFKSSLLKNLDQASFQFKKTIDDVTKCNLQLKKAKGNLLSDSMDGTTRQVQLAIEKIDATTFILEKIKENIIISIKNLYLASNKTQDVTAKRLTRISRKK